jgi:hypothetical protein
MTLFLAGVVKALKIQEKRRSVELVAASASQARFQVGEPIA